MAHYAYIDDNFEVIAVIVGKDETEFIDGLSPEVYYALGTPFMVKRTSYTGKIRKQYAGVGYTYDAELDIFIAPRPFDSWNLDENHDWQPPIPYPNDGLRYWWDEENRDWVLYVEQAEA